MPDYAQIRQQVQALQETAIDLTAWEHNFLKSVVGQFKQRGWISAKQIAVVERLYVEKVPPP